MYKAEQHVHLLLSMLTGLHYALSHKRVLLLLLLFLNIISITAKVLLLIFK